MGCIGFMVSQTEVAYRGISKKSSGKGQFDSVLSLSLEERRGGGGEGGSLWLLEEVEVGRSGVYSICCDSCTDHPPNM